MTQHIGGDYNQLIEKTVPFDPNEKQTPVVEGYPFTQVPVTKHPYDERDDEIKLLEQITKDDIMGGEGGIFERKRLSQREVSLYRKRLEEQQEVDFEKFILNVLPSNDPYTLEILDKQFPEIIRSREKSIDEYCDFLKKLTQIALRGLQTKEDWALMYNIQTGRISIPPNIIANIFNLQLQNGQPTLDNMKRGLFNPRKHTQMKGRSTQLTIPNCPFPLIINEDGSITIKQKDGSTPMPSVDFNDNFLTSFQ